MVDYADISFEDNIIKRLEQHYENYITRCDVREYDSPLGVLSAITIDLMVNDGVFVKFDEKIWIHELIEVLKNVKTKYNGIIYLVLPNGVEQELNFNE